MKNSISIIEFKKRDGFAAYDVFNINGKHIGTITYNTNWLRHEFNQYSWVALRSDELRAIADKIDKIDNKEV